MAGSTLIYFGRDLCYRTFVMRNAGYQIAECAQLPELSMALARHPDAVLLAGESQIPLDQVIVLARSASEAPLILFMSETAPTQAVDLVIPTLTVPGQWLYEIGALIERFHEAQSKALLRTQSTDCAASKKTDQMSIHGYELVEAAGGRKGVLEQMPVRDWQRRYSS